MQLRKFNGSFSSERASELPSSTLSVFGHVITIERARNNKPVFRVHVVLKLLIAERVSLALFAHCEDLTYYRDRFEKLRRRGRARAHLSVRPSFGEGVFANGKQRRSRPIKGGGGEERIGSEAELAAWRDER